VIAGLAVLLLAAPLPLFGQQQLRGDWLRFALAGRSDQPGWGTSSVLESETPLQESRYGPEKALDGDPATAWVEGAPGAGRGEWYALGLTHCPEALGVYNGYAKNRDLFLKNHRIKTARVRVYAAVNVSGFVTELAEVFDAVPLTASKTVRFADTMEAQRIELPFDPSEVRARMEAFRRSEVITARTFPQAEEMGIEEGEGPPLNFRCILHLEIGEVYEGSTWHDTCLAELWPDYGKPASVKLSKDSRALLITDETGRHIPTYADSEYVLSLADLSPGGEWAVVLKEPAYLEPGERAETEYALIHTPTGRDVSAQILDDPARFGIDLLPTGFTREGSAVFLEYEDLAGGESGRAACRLY
jgi:hypothetical protein